MAGEYIGVRRGIFPVPLLDAGSLDFSFSGLKSAVKREIDQRKAIHLFQELSTDDMREIAFEFEQAIGEVLITKLFRAAEQFGVPTIMLAGGVSANDFLRSSIALRAKSENLTFFAPTKKLYSMDNAAMIGIRAWYENLKY